MPKKKFIKNKRPARRARGSALVPRVPSEPFQRCIQLIVPGTTFTYSTTTGAFGYSNNINVGALINNFATRFGATFVEYRMLKVVFEIICTTNSTGGVSYFYIDEQTATTPSLAASQNHRSVRLCNNSQAASGKTRLTWRNKDLLDLEFFDVGNTTQNVGYLKAYTDTTLGTPSTSVSNLFLVIPITTVEFRGIR